MDNNPPVIANPYILVGYKKDSDDYCRGCHMASYPSDFRCSVGLNDASIIEPWAEMLAYQKDCGESGYRISVIVNTTYGLLL